MKTSIEIEAERETVIEMIAAMVDLFAYKIDLSKAQLVKTVTDRMVEKCRSSPRDDDLYVQPTTYPNCPGCGKPLGPIVGTGQSWIMNNGRCIVVTGQPPALPTPPLDTVDVIGTASIQDQIRSKAELHWRTTQDLYECTLEETQLLHNEQPRVGSIYLLPHRDFAPAPSIDVLYTVPKENADLIARGAPFTDIQKRRGILRFSTGFERDNLALFNHVTQTLCVIRSRRNMPDGYILVDCMSEYFDPIEQSEIAPNYSIEFTTIEGQAFPKVKFTRQ